MRVKINYVGVGLLASLLFLVFHYYKGSGSRPKTTHNKILTLSTENDRTVLRTVKKTTTLATTNDDQEESNRIKFTQLQYGLDGLEHSQEAQSRHFKEELQGIKESQSQILEKQESYNEIQKEFVDRQKILEETLKNLKKHFDDEHDERMREREYGQKKLHRLIRAEKEIKKQRQQQVKEQKKNDKEQKDANESEEDEAKRMIEEQLKRDAEEADYQAEEERKEMEAERQQQREYEQEHQSHQQIQTEGAPSGLVVNNREDLNQMNERGKMTTTRNSELPSGNRIQKKKPSSVGRVYQSNYPVTFDEVAMLHIHNATYSKNTHKEVREFYDRERVSKKKYGERVLDVKRDRDVLMALFPGPNEKRDRVTDQLRVRLNVKDTKIIYLKSSVNTQQKFDNDKCKVNKCTFTNDINLLPHVDAIYSELDTIPQPFDIQNKNQIKIRFQLESSDNYPTLTSDTAIFNWTATYRVDSVLNAPYERFVTKLSVTDLPTKPLENYAKGKKKMAAWFVSNCHAGSGRQDYIKDLQKYITVDVYGLCGRKCSKKDKKCFEQLNTDYKFYMAFENSHCKDYLTEKPYWNALFYKVVPVVFGAHRDDYKRQLPPNSYILAEDFESPKHLADYLIYLDHNDDLYNQYFLWKGTGKFINTKFLCRLCTMVHLAPHFPMWYSEVNDWWGPDKTCVQPERHKHLMYSSWGNKTRPSEFSEYVHYGYKRID
eukprot:TCONS_00021393-protein